MYTLFTETSWHKHLGNNTPKSTLIKDGWCCVYLKHSILHSSRNFSIYFALLEQRQSIIIGFLGTRRFHLKQTCFISDSKAAALQQVAGLLETFHNTENRTWQILYCPSLLSVNPVALPHKCLSTNARTHTHKMARTHMWLLLLLFINILSVEKIT